VAEMVGYVLYEVKGCLLNCVRPSMVAAYRMMVFLRAVTDCQARLLLRSIDIIRLWQVQPKDERFYLCSTKRLGGWMCVWVWYVPPEVTVQKYHHCANIKNKIKTYLS
jgi:hypothetical protein